MEKLLNINDLKQVILGDIDKYGVVNLFHDELSDEDFNNFCAQKEKFLNDMFYIAVIGRQGVGKSSLLNALLLEDKIIPIDITETTNVLTKIHSSESGPDHCEVLFKDGSIINGDFTTDFLNLYVNQEYNPDNQKNVKEVNCYTNKLIIPKGVVFVDTPGVESLNENNGRVTYEFLPEMTAGIFLFSTNPCLLECEIEFLKASWRFSNQYFFVQNIFNESELNIKLSKDKNMDFLNEIANQFEYNKKFEVYDVNVDIALQGRCNYKDIDLNISKTAEQWIESSNIKELENSIISYLNKEPTKLKINEFIIYLLGKIDKLMKSFQIRKYELTEGINKTDEEFYTNMNKMREELSQKESEWNETKREFGEDILNIKNDAVNELSNELINLNNEISNFIENEKLNPDKLNSIFKDKISLLTDKLAHKYAKIYKERLEEYINKFETINVNNIINDLYKNNNVFTNDSVLDFGKDIGNFASYLGGLGLSFIVGEYIYVAVDAWLKGAAIATGAVPVWGWIASGALLLIGFGAKKVFSEKLKSKLILELNKNTNRYEKILKEEIENKFYKQALSFSTKIDNVFKSDAKRIKETQITIENERKMNKKEQLNILKNIENNINLLNNFSIDIRPLLSFENQND